MVLWSPRSNRYFSNPVSQISNKKNQDSRIPFPIKNLIFFFLSLLNLKGGMAFAFAFYILSWWISQNWRTEWVIDMFWEFLFFFVMAGIAVLWRPRANNTRLKFVSSKKREF
jgi:hypothetical protein